MNELRRLGDHVWDEFFEFLYPCEEPVAVLERDAELARLEIDVSPAVKRVLDAAKAARARERLRQARAGRESALARMSKAVPATASAIRENLHTLISQLAGSQQAAYFRKLEDAHSEQDLLSLYEDMQRLNELAKGSSGGDENSDQ